MRYFDLDEFVEKKIGNIINYSRKSGVEAYRSKESEIVEDFCSGLPESCVFSVGGGTIASQFERINRKNVSFLKKCGKIVYLAPPEDEREAVKVIFSRERKRRGDKDYSETLKLLRLRRSSYEKFSDIRIDVQDKTPGKVADEIVSKL